MPIIKKPLDNASLEAAFFCRIGHRPIYFDRPDHLYTTYCNLSAHGCICSEGCGSSWACRPSSLCSQPVPAGVDDPTNTSSSISRSSSSGGGGIDPQPLPPRVAMLLFLAFNHSLVRGKFSHKPQDAYNREYSRIRWFVQSAKRVKTRLPIHVIVGPERNLEKEMSLKKLGVHITVGHPVEPPKWANKYHRLTFNKIGALALTQFDKVFVFDNDMALARNIDHLAFAETPSAVWHTSLARWQWRHNESCAVTTGLLGLTPSATDFSRALKYLHSMGNRSVYDGGDQEFWRKFYTWYELPLRYQAHQSLNMPYDEWRQIRVLHSISGLREVNRIPKDMRHFIKYFY